MLCEIAHVEDQFLKEKIVEGHQRLRGILGYPRMRIWLKKTYGIHVNHKRVYRLMKQMGIQAQIRKKKRYYDKKEVCVVSDNVLNRDFHATRPNEKWVTDITYIPYKQKNLYLSAICDLFNNEIIAFHLSTRNDLQLVIDTLEKARKVRKTKVSSSIVTRGISILPGILANF
ncbi:IS3 family transposase [Paenibacillus larvae]|uniref:IS3 family transposase n=1 Tax=Paenibacillus larvae TaxID=1464 RepID=UPI003990C13D